MRAEESSERRRSKEARFLKVACFLREDRSKGRFESERAKGARLRRGTLLGTRKGCVRGGVCLGRSA